MFDQISSSCAKFLNLHQQVHKQYYVTTLAHFPMIWGQQLYDLNILQRVSSTELMSRVIVKSMSANRVLAQGLLLKPIYKVEFDTVLMSAHLGSVNKKGINDFQMA